MGGTLAELANYILLNGGQVAGSIVLVNAGRSKDFQPVTLSALEPLTRSEIDALRQKKREISIYYQKVMAEHFRKEEAQGT